MIDPKELEELKATMRSNSCKDCADYNGTCPNDGLPCDSFFRLRVKLEAFIKKHEPKPPWPPEEGQLIYILKPETGVSPSRYDGSCHYSSLQNGFLFPNKHVVVYIANLLADKDLEYWEKKMELERDTNEIIEGLTGED
ncbi:MAG: hypothetical protein OES84_00195 [Kiritimatiellaceae bacterium]|nr:hypothetical protein [Kiritimatiellaceae bacterium]